MLSKKLFALLACLPLVSIALGACQQKPEIVGGFEIPQTERNQFNVAMVLIGPHNDGGWSQAHYEGLQYVQENMEGVHTAYIENVPEGRYSVALIDQGLPGVPGDRVAARNRVGVQWST